eukprot:UN24129
MPFDKAQNALREPLLLCHNTCDVVMKLQVHKNDDKEHKNEKLDKNTNKKYDYRRASQQLQGSASVQISGVKSEKDKCLSIIRNFGEENNLFQHVPKGYGYFTSYFSRYDSYSGIGGIEGTDEIHIWGDPFTRQQKRTCVPK